MLKKIDNYVILKLIGILLKALISTRGQWAISFTWATIGMLELAYWRYNTKYLDKVV